MELMCGDALLGTVPYREGLKIRGGRDKLQNHKKITEVCPCAHMVIYFPLSAAMNDGNQCSGVGAVKSPPGIHVCRCLCKGGKKGGRKTGESDKLAFFAMRKDREGCLRHCRRCLTL